MGIFNLFFANFSEMQIKWIIFPLKHIHLYSNKNLCLLFLRLQTILCRRTIYIYFFYILIWSYLPFFLFISSVVYVNKDLSHPNLPNKKITSYVLPCTKWLPNPLLLNKNTYSLLSTWPVLHLNFNHLYMTDVTGWKFLSHFWIL